MNCEIRDGILHLDGEITVKTVHGNAYRQFVQLSGGDIKAVDLSAVSRADSACLSLLFSVLRRHGSRPAHLFRRPPNPPGSRPKQKAKTPTNATTVSCSK